MMTVILLALVGCASNSVAVDETTGTADSSLTDSATTPVERAICTVDEFCDSMQACYRIMGDGICGRYYEDGMGTCKDQTAAVMDDYHLCMCDCWTAENDDRSCFAKGTCSDMCATTVCWRD